MDTDGDCGAASPHVGNVLLVLLLAADAVFVVLHLIHELTPYLYSQYYSLRRDRSYGEFFQYVQFFWILLLVGALAWRTREPVYGSWALLFAYLLLDDALQIHERAGGMVAALWGLHAVFGLRAQDLGELAVSAAAGAVLLAALVLGWLRSGRDARNAALALATLVGVLAFFGVVVDMVHVLVDPDGSLDLAFATLEDGGEMVAVSVIFWYTLRLFDNGGRPVTSLHARAAWLIAPRTRAARLGIDVPPSDR